MSEPVADLPATGWRLPDDACAVLARLVGEHRPGLVVEAGSGRSTVVLAEAVSVYEGRVVALEHEARYAAETRALLWHYDLARYADVRLAPLEDGWYTASAYADLHGIGLLFVDGPPGHVARHARAPALPLLRDRLLPGCVLVLDDVDREAERAIWQEWGIAGTVVAHAKASLAYGTVA